MAETAESLITRAYVLCGALRPGQSLTTDELSDGLKVLNEMLANWAEDRILGYKTDTMYFNLSPGQVIYSVGISLPGAAELPFEQTQPIHVVESWLSPAGTLPSEGPKYPFKLISVKEYSRIYDPTETGQPTKGWLVYGGYNEGRESALYIDKNPDQIYNIVLASKFRIARFQSLSDELETPASYERAVKFNLALELGAELGAPLDPRVIKTAEDSLTKIKNANIAREVSPIGVDSALVRSSRYDIASDR